MNTDDAIQGNALDKAAKQQQRLEERDALRKQAAEQLKAARVAEEGRLGEYVTEAREKIKQRRETLTGLLIENPVTKKQQNYNSLIKYDIKLADKMSEAFSLSSEELNLRLNSEISGVGSDSSALRFVELGIRAIERNISSNGRPLNSQYLAETEGRELGVGDYYIEGLLSADSAITQVINRGSRIARVNYAETSDLAVSTLLNFDENTLSELGSTSIASNALGFIPAISMSVASAQISALEKDKETLNLLYNIGAIDSGALERSIQEAGVEQIQAGISGPLGFIGKIGLGIDLFVQGLSSAEAGKGGKLRFGLGGQSKAKNLDELLLSGKGNSGSSLVPDTRVVNTVSSPTGLKVGLDNDGVPVKWEYNVGQKGARGTGYKNIEVGAGNHRGHVKSVNEGAGINSIDDSFHNIIEQTSKVNLSNVKRFENWRVKNAQGAGVVVERLDNGFIRTTVPSKNIDVTYNPLSNTRFDKDWFLKGGIHE